jgi:hypothetical protein
VAWALSVFSGSVGAFGFVVNYTDSAGHGFKDSSPVSAVGGNAGVTLGEQRRNAFEFALARWGERLQSSQTVTVDADFADLGCTSNSGTLGAASVTQVTLSAPIPPGAQSNTFYPKALAKALKNTDIASGSPDILVTFNLLVDSSPSCLGGAGFYYGFDQIPGSRIDFLNVAMHELGHGLGFISHVDETTGVPGSGIFAIFDRFLFDETTTMFWPAMTAGQRVISATSSGNLTFNAANTNTGGTFLTAAGKTNNHVRMYAPDPVESGSSVSHWDEVALLSVGSRNLLMEPFATADVRGAQSVDLTTCLFRDIGWTLIAPFTCPDVAGANTPPTISNIADKLINEDGATAAIAFTVGDTETPAAALTVSGASSNVTPPALNPNIVFGGSGSNRTVTVTPAANQSGAATITVTVSDGTTTSNDTFVLTVTAVNDAPLLNAISNLTIAEDAGAQVVNLGGIGAGGGESQTLAVTASSNNTALIPNPTVSYSSPNATGSLSLAPAANQSGTATITVIVTDNGGTANGGVNTVSRSFTVTVNSVNDAPTLNAISNPAAIPVSSGVQQVNLAGIAAGGGETAQALTVAASSNNTGLIPNPTVSYTTPNATGSLSYTPVAGQSGSATITVTVTDDGGTANGGVNTFTRTFLVAVGSVNAAPTLNPISNVTILEDASTQLVNLSGISAGGESQTLTVAAQSSNPGLIPNPAVSYTSPAATGSLSFAPVANQSGSAVVTVTVTDNGGTANGGVNTTTRTFTVSVSPVNDAPTLNAISNPAAIPANSGAQVVNLGGIGAGGGESQTLTVTASSNNTGLIPNPTVSYTSANATGSLSYTPVANQSGSAVVTVTVTDNGGTTNGGVNTVSRTFTVAVSGGGPVPNAAPTLNAIDNLSVLEDAGAQTVNLGGISAGGGETQTLTVTATSNNPGLVPDPAVTYSSPNATGSLSLTSAANQSGDAVITVTVTDNGGTANGGVNTTSRTFTVTVNGVNDAPTLNAIPNPPEIPVNASVQTVNLSGISAGGGESQNLTVTASSSNTSLIPNPVVTYSSPNATGSVAYTPVAAQSGSAVITVTVTDGGGTASGGVNAATRSFTVTVNAIEPPPPASGGGGGGSWTLSALLSLLLMAAIRRVHAQGTRSVQ